MAIVNPTIVELSEKVDSRYTLVVEASKRARQLVDGAQPLVDPKDMKPPEDRYRRNQPRSAHLRARPGGTGVIPCASSWA